MTAEKRVKLRGILDHTASSAAITADGSLVVELYDFSPEAHRWLGNDVAFLLNIDAAGHFADAYDDDAALLQLLAERFDDYYDVERWLNDEGIPFRKEFEPWA
jgi:hypothetical protein